MVVSYVLVYAELQVSSLVEGKKSRHSKFFRRLVCIRIKTSGKYCIPNNSIFYPLIRVSAAIYVGFIFISVVTHLTTFLTPFCTRKLTSVFKRERLDGMLLSFNTLVTVLLHL